MLKNGHELATALVHCADRLIIVQIDRERPLVEFRKSAEHQHVIAAGKDENEATVGFQSRLADAVGLGNSRNLFPIVAHANQRTPQGTDGISGEIARPSPVQFTMAVTPN